MSAQTKMDWLPVKHGPLKFPAWNSAESEDLMARHIAARCECGRDFTSIRDYAAVQQPEPRIVAECWTCEPNGPLYLRSPLSLNHNDAETHRAAGHDVREVTK